MHRAQRAVDFAAFYAPHKPRVCVQPDRAARICERERHRSMSRDNARCGDLRAYNGSLPCRI